MMKIIEARIKVDTTAPEIAPKVVAISRNIPTLIFVILSYAEAAPLDVAMTEIILAPTAKWMLICNSNVRAGTIITPPPKPKSEPRKPAAIENRKTMRRKIMGSIL